MSLIIGSSEGRGVTGSGTMWTRSGQSYFHAGTDLVYRPPVRNPSPETFSQLVTESCTYTMFDNYPDYFRTGRILATGPHIHRKPVY